MGDVKTRLLHNQNDPICYPDGSPYANSEVSFQLVTAKTKKATSVFDAVSAELILGDEVVVLTDANGFFEVELWPNNRGEIPTVYKASVGPAKTFLIYIPESDTPISLVEARADVLGASPQELTAFQTLLNTINEQLVTFQQPVSQGTNGLMSISNLADLTMAMRAYTRIVHAEDYTTLAEADAAAVAAGRPLLVTTQWNTVPATVQANVIALPGAVFNSETNVAFNGEFLASKFKCFIGHGVYTFTSVKVTDVLYEWWAGDNDDQGGHCLANAVIAAKPVSAVVHLPARQISIIPGLRYIDIEGVELRGVWQKTIIKQDWSQVDRTKTSYTMFNGGNATKMRGIIFDGDKASLTWWDASTQKSSNIVTSSSSTSAVCTGVVLENIEYRNLPGTTAVESFSFGIHSLRQATFKNIVHKNCNTTFHIPGRLHLGIDDENNWSKGVIIEGFYVYNTPGTDLGWMGLGTYGAKDVKITDIHVEGLARNGINLEWAVNVTVKGLTAVTCGQAGINTYGYVENVDIPFPVLIGNGWGGSSTKGSSIAFRCGSWWTAGIYAQPLNGNPISVRVYKPRIVNQDPAALAHILYNTTLTTAVPNGWKTRPENIRVVPDVDLIGALTQYTEDSVVTNHQGSFYTGHNFAQDLFTAAIKVTEIVNTTPAEVTVVEIPGTNQPTYKVNTTGAYRWVGTPLLPGRYAIYAEVSNTGTGDWNLKVSDKAGSVNKLLVRISAAANTGEFLPIGNIVNVTDGTTYIQFITDGTVGIPYELQIRNLRIVQISSAAGYPVTDFRNGLRKLYVYAMPSTGEFTVGDFAENMSKTVTGIAGNQYIIKGWQRLTRGNTNTLGADWIEVREPVDPVVNQIYRASFGGAADTSWKKLATAVVVPGGYKGAEFDVEITSSWYNPVPVGSSYYEKHKFAIVITRSGAVDLDHDNAVIIGSHTDFVRVVKTQNDVIQSVYELQVRQVATYKTMEVAAKLTSVSGTTVTWTGPTSINSANGATVGTVYTAQNALPATGNRPLTGSGAPTTVPNYLGQEYRDTTNGKWYKAKGTTATADWTEIVGASTALTDSVAAPVTSQSAYVKVLTLPAGETSAERLVYCGTNNFICGTEGTAKIYTSSDSGATWVDRGRIGGTTTETSIYGLLSIGSGIVLAGTSTNGKLWRSTNYGVSFTQITGGYADAGASHDLRGFAYMGSGVVLLGNSDYSAAGKSGKIWRSTDSGQTWAPVYDGSLTTDLYYITSMCNVGNSTALAIFAPAGLGSVTTGKILRSTDNGLTWSVATSFNSPNCVTIGTNGAGTALVGIAQGGPDVGKILRTTDYGATWTDLGVPIAGAAIFNGITWLGGTSYLVGTNGTGTASCSVWQTDDNGTTWRLIQQLDDGTSDITVYTFAYNEAKTIVCGTYKPGGVGKIWRSLNTVASFPSIAGKNLAGSGAPVAAPTFIGQEYLDVAATPKKWYKAAGTAVADWIALN